MIKERLIFDPETKLLIDVDTVDVTENEDGTFSYEEVPNTYVVIESLGPIFRPMLVDGEVVEGKEQWEFEEEAMNDNLNPSHEDLKEAEFEIMLIDKLFSFGLL